MTTSTSLGLRALLKTAIARAGLEAPAAAVSGLTPAAQALFVAAAAHAQPKGAVLFVVPGDADVERAAADARFFLGALEGWSEDAAYAAVLPLPSHEVDPYRGLAPHLGVTSARARALHALAAGTARVVVASSAALLPRVSAPRLMIEGSIELAPGLDVAPGDLAALLIDAGFTREDPADEHGEFAMRGGILDVFPAGAAQPVRLEFIGDTIESLRYYDPATQRSIEAVDRITIVPLKDVLDEGTSTLFDYLSAGRSFRIVVSEPDEVEAQVRKISEQIRASYENLPESADAPTPDDLLLDWDEVAEHLGTATMLSQLDTGTTESRHIACQPAVEMRGRVGDWVAEVGRRRADGDTVLFVAATAGRAERTIELLKEYEVFAAPVERADDARYAARARGPGAAVARLPAPGRRSPDLRRERRLRRGAARRRSGGGRTRARSCPICAT